MKPDCGCHLPSADQKRQAAQLRGVRGDVAGLMQVVKGRPLYLYQLLIKFGSSRPLGAAITSGACEMGTASS